MDSQSNRRLTRVDKLELGKRILTRFAKGQTTLSNCCLEAGIKPATFRNWVMADVNDIERYLAAGNSLPSNAYPELIPLYREAKILAASNWEANITDSAQEGLAKLVRGYTTVEVKVKRVRDKDIPIDKPEAFYDEVTTTTKQIAPNMEAVRMVLEAKAATEYDKDTRKRLAEAESLQKAMDADVNEYEEMSIDELKRKIMELDVLKQGADGVWQTQ